MSKESIREILEQRAKENFAAKYQIIDETLFKLLREQNVTNSTDRDEISKALVKNNIEIVMKQTHNTTGDIYEFKLCRVFASEKVCIQKMHL
jgi:NH3-dependent NAD+ synthetase